MSFFVKIGCIGLCGIVLLIVTAPYRMKRIISFVLSLFLILSVGTSALAYSESELVGAVKSYIDLPVTSEQVQIKAILALNDHTTVFSYRLVNGDFAYTDVILDERMGKYLYTHGLEGALYLYDGKTVTDLSEAYTEGCITEEQLDQIASAFPAKPISVNECTGGLFCVAFQYEKQYKEQLSVTDNQKIDYREVYHHMNKNNEEIWALACDRYRLRGIAEDNDSLRSKDKIITYFSDDTTKNTSPYGIYDVSKKQYYDLSDIIDDADMYDGLEETIAALGISRPVGDSDYDGYLTILDATYIQRYLAGMVDITAINSMVSDFDNDGEVTILDPTAIQRRLAELD